MSKSLLAILVLSVLGIYVSGILVTESATFAVSGEMGCVAGNTGCLRSEKHIFENRWHPYCRFGLGFYLTAFMSVVALFWRTQETGLRYTFCGFVALVGIQFLGWRQRFKRLLLPILRPLYGINWGYLSQPL